jgi:anti-sigma factor RsiW
MLSEHDLELLTAFVDGELTRRQRKAVLRLLHRSSEARSVLQDFQENAHRLRELPHVRLGDHFAGQVIEAIAKRGLRPLPGPVAVPRRHFRPWEMYAAAASILLVVGVSVYLATRETGDIVANGPMAQDKSKAGSASAIALGKLPFSFKELTEKRSQELLAKRLKKEPSVHLDVMVRDGVKAMEHSKGRTSS